jgi:hypothetical protein
MQELRAEQPKVRPVHHAKVPPRRVLVRGDDGGDDDDDDDDASHLHSFFYPSDTSPRVQRPRWSSPSSLVAIPRHRSSHI